MAAGREERRRATRSPVNLAMELSGLPDSSGPGPVSSESLNLSTEGVYCTVDHYIAPLTRLALAIVLPVGAEGEDAAEGGHVIRCEAVAVRSYPERESPGCSAYEIACYFTSMNDEDRRLLERFLEAGATAH